MTGSTPLDPISHLSPTASQQAVLRLLIIPLLVYCAWLAEIYLLEGNQSLFLAPGALPLVFYTVVGCILTGMLIPVLIIRRSFISGTVNMFQIGFRSVGRTLAVCTITGVACYLIASLMTPAGNLHMDFHGLFLLYLPTGIAAVIICWVLVGTHVQALVRAGGAVLSIPTGIVVTAILFGLTPGVHTPAPGLPDPFVAGILLGLLTAFFFFSVRDVYATGIVVTTGMTLVFPGRVDPAALESALPAVVLSALLVFFTLLAIHGYFLRNYTTVMVVPDR